MHADYIANPLYDNNPFIEALPPMLSGKDLIRALAVIPPYSDSDRDRSTGERLQLLSSLYEFYQPLSMTIDLYCEIYTAMQHCYGQYSVQSEAAAFQKGYSLMHGNALAASIGGGNSFSVVGVSGLGKSTALQRVLSLYPQVIEHTEYHGQKFYCHQIPYLVVQTPHDASIKALILDIYLQIDSLIGTCYQKDALSRRLSIDLLDFIEQQGWQDLQMVEGISLLDVLGTLPKGSSGAGAETRTKKPSSTRKYICPKCGNSCRATKVINLICGDCMEKMVVAE